MDIKDKIIYATFDQVPSFKGASTHILSTCRDSYRFNKQINLFCLGDQKLPESEFFKHHPVHIIERNYLKRAQKFQNRLQDFININKFKFGHFRGPFEGRVLLEHGMKCIYEVNSVPSYELPYLYGRLPESVHRSLMTSELFCLQNSQVIICPSPKLKEFILNRYHGIEESKIQVIENGCDVAKNRPLIYCGGTLKVVYLGTLHPWQGLLWLLKVLRDYPLNIQLDIYPSSLKKWSKDLHRLILKYKLEDKVNVKGSLHKGLIHSTLTKYHFGIAPLIKMRRNNIQGCCPVKIKDYLSCGLPVIAPDLEVVTNLLEHNKSALIYETGKINALGELLTNVIRSPLIQEEILTHNLKNKDKIFTWTDYNDLLYRIDLN